ncbi:MAG: VOC family protein [Egibacteraceae bacterium]
MVLSEDAAIELHHIGLGSESPGECVDVLRSVLGFATIEESADYTEMILGSNVARVHSKATSVHPYACAHRTLQYLALSVASISDLGARLQVADIGFERAEDPEGAELLYLHPNDWCGVALLAIPAPARQANVLPDDANIRGIDHIGIASPDNALAQSRFADLLGLAIESRQTDTEMWVRVEQFNSDKYGVVMVTQESVEDVRGLRALFLSLSDLELEFLQDLGMERAVARGAGQGGATNSTAGDQNAIMRHIERFGPGMSHIAIRVRSIEDALGHAEAKGARLIDRHGRPGSRRALIGFLHPRSTAKVLVHFVERPEGDERGG